jgi:Type IV secretion-system coupling protein DNA-binding domain
MNPKIRYLVLLLLPCLLCAPGLALAQTSPFMTGATALQTNILAWLTPVAIILVMILGGMAMANRIAQVSTTYGQGDAHTIVENCGNTLILRCSASEGGGTARFASQLVGDREVLRTTSASSRRCGEFIGSKTRSEHYSVEAALLPSEIEQLPDLTGYVKLASTPHWQRVDFSSSARPISSRSATSLEVVRQSVQRMQPRNFRELE